MHHAVRHAVTTRDLSQLELLLQIGLLKCAVNDQDHSIFEPLIESETNEHVTSMIFKLFVIDFNFDIQQEIISLAVTEVDLIEHSDSVLDKFFSIQSLMDIYSFDSDIFNRACEAVKAKLESLEPQNVNCLRGGKCRVVNFIC